MRNRFQNRKADLLKETYQPERDKTTREKTPNTSVALEVHFPNSSDKGLLRHVFDFAKGCGLSRIYCAFPAHAGEDPPNLPDVSKSGQQAFFMHTPLLQAAMLKEVHQFPQIFQPLLFCRKNYFKKHRSWGLPVFHFIDDQPEIYTVEARKRPALLRLDNPEDVCAVYMFKRGSGALQSDNLIHGLDRESGALEIQPLDETAEIVVIRRCYLFYKNGLSYRLNLHDDFILKRHRPILPEEGSGYHGALINADALFGSSSLVSAGPEITRIYSHLSPHHFRHDLALFWLRFGNKTGVTNPALVRMINHYISGVFWPKTKLIAKEVRLQADVLNPYFINNLAALYCDYRVDEDRFLHDRSYYLRALVNLKRSATYRASKDVFKTSVICDYFLCDKFGFHEKREIVSALAAAGAGNFVFPLHVPPSSTPTLIHELLRDGEQQLLYRKWAETIQKLTSFLNDGTNGTEIAILYPGLDADDDTFLQALNTLDAAGYDPDVLDFESFLDKECRIEDKRLVFKGRRYALLILAGIKLVTIDVMRKVERFLASGGCVAGLKNLPVKCADEANNSILKRILKEGWVTTSRLNATTFRAHPGGGLAYFQSDARQIIDILGEIDERFVHSVAPPAKGVKTITRIAGDTRYVFLFNNTTTTYERLPVSYPVESLVSVYSDNQHHFEPLYEKAVTLKPLQSVLLKVEEKQQQLQAPGRQWIKYRDVEIESSDWHLDDGELEYRISLGDRSRTTPFNWRRQIYTKMVVLPEKPGEDVRILLNLGDLRDWCTLYWNNLPVETRLFEPWLFDITGRVLKGKNVLAVEIGYRLSNYYAGVNGTTERLHPVVAYGLLGPVKIEMYSPA